MKKVSAVLKSDKRRSVSSCVSKEQDGVVKSSNKFFGLCRTSVPITLIILGLCYGSTNLVGLAFTPTSTLKQEQEDVVLMNCDQEQQHLPDSNNPTFNSDCAHDDSSRNVAQLEDVHHDTTVGMGAALFTAGPMPTEEESVPVSFTGPFAYIRSKLDYSYHKRYSRDRQLLQDSIIELMMNSTIVMDSSTGRVCSVPLSKPWIVFTAGAMGAGKTHTIKYLHANSYFPLHAFVTVDPDEIRRHLPEYKFYAKHSPIKAGALTRKEAGYISEILTKASLDEGRNVLVDGSLRDHEWYKHYFARLRHQYVDLNVAIFHITAPREAVFERAMKRGLDTGRVVPLETLQMALEVVPKSVQILAPLVNFFCEFFNDSAISQDDEIRLVTNGVTWETFKAQWEQICPIPLEDSVYNIGFDHDGTISPISSSMVTVESTTLPHSKM